MPGLYASDRWQVRAQNPEAARFLKDAYGLEGLVARVLAARGITDPEQVETYLSPSLARDWHDPSEIPGLEAVAQRVEQAIVAGESIAVFGDFDVDGMSSASLLCLALRELGARVHAFIPHRFGEGYGLSEQGMARVIQQCDPSLVVTVDNGISSAAEVDYVRSLGIDVAVTDHHEPGAQVPQGVPVADPKLDPHNHSRDLAGVGVALKLVQAVGRRVGRPELWRNYLDLASLGTVSDMMELTCENRALVTEGIAQMRQGLRPGLVALARTARTDIARINADNLPFSLVPRLNAAGRMGQEDVAFNLLLTSDPLEAEALASELESINASRRSIESDMAAEAFAQAEEVYEGGPCLVLAHEGWHEGVKGVVASRVASRYKVPTLLFTIKDGIASGSGRSVGQVDLFHAVESCSDLLLRFGGHPKAVGVTLEADKLPQFKERLTEWLDQVDPAEFLQVDEVVCTVRLSELSLGAVASLDLLRPFGQGNREPLFAACGLTLRGASPVGAQGDHVHFYATDGTTSLPAIMFRAPNVARVLAWEGVVDLVFEATVEQWQGKSKVKLMVRDILFRDEQPQDPGDQQLIEGLFASPAAQDAAAEQTAAFATRPPEAAPALSPEPSLAALPLEGLTAKLKGAFIGDHELLPCQAQVLDALAQGKSCLAIMATGRGKSLIFQLHAARLALKEHKPSIFVYPLRALVNDQAFHLEESFGALGLKVRVLCGETPQEQRDEIFGQWAAGRLDTLLTTPEFLALHSAQLAQAPVGFVVIDEAHHAGLSKGGNREAYQELPRVLQELGAPQVLACTATATTAAAQEICRLASIDAVFTDLASRDNLHLVDERNPDDLIACAASHLSAQQKAIAYTNTRDAAVRLARELRRRVPELGHRIAFYHGGMTRIQRLEVEQAFRAGRLSCIVATSAFGEGVNLPDVRSVMLCSLPYGRVEFNQMSGRAGRDGLPAEVCLLYGPADIATNQAVLGAAAPSRQVLVSLYRALRTLEDPASYRLAFDASQILGLARSIDSSAALTPGALEQGVAVFSELGFCSVEGFGEDRVITMVDGAGRMDLLSSARYSEGVAEQQAFGEFASWALEATASELEGAVDRPIAPSEDATLP